MSKQLTTAHASSRSELALLLKSARISKELGVRDVARAAGLSVRRVASIERGDDAFLSEIQACLAAMGFELRLDCRERQRARKSP